MHSLHGQTTSWDILCCFDPVQDIFTDALPSSQDYMSYTCSSGALFHCHDSTVNVGLHTSMAVTMVLSVRNVTRTRRTRQHRSSKSARDALCSSHLWMLTLPWSGQMHSNESEHDQVGDAKQCPALHFAHHARILQRFKLLKSDSTGRFALMGSVLILGHSI
eukprot:763612-Hanusia_phi.AAC.8